MDSDLQRWRVSDYYRDTRAIQVAKETGNAWAYPITEGLEECCKCQVTFLYSLETSAPLSLPAR
jgi:hypothetical protein